MTLGPTLVSLLLSLGACAWLYPKVYNRQGADNGRQTLITLGVIGFVIFIILELFIGMFLK